MKLYHCPNSRSVRIVWLMEELGLDYELEVFALGDKAMRAPEFLKFHPGGRVPALEDGEIQAISSADVGQRGAHPAR